MDADEKEYYTSYEDLEIHKLMLEDDPRTISYKNAIINNATFFKGKVVMDVGCGTGILSLFCAQAGAKKVYAVEVSNLALLAKEVVKENNFEDVIEVIHSRIEDVVLPNNVKVDAIVSEWMGFYLLHEGMLDSVFVARDKFLKEGGELFPETAAIYIAPCSVSSLYKKWENFHGVSLSTFAKQLRVSKSSKPEILNVHQEDLLGEEVALNWIDLKNDTITDLNSYSIQHVVSAIKSGPYQGLCLWFECNFPQLCKANGDSYVTLNTSPKSPWTHWKQTVIVLPTEQQVEEGEPIAFQLDMNRDQDNGRRYNLQMTLLDPDTIDHPIPCTCHMTKCILIKTMLNAENKVQNVQEKSSSNVLEDEAIETDDDD